MGCHLFLLITRLGLHVICILTYLANYSMSKDNKKAKRECKFTNDLQKEYPFLHKSEREGCVHCNTCGGDFSIAHGGKNDITRHIQSMKHSDVVKARVQAASNSRSNLLNFVVTETFTDKKSKLAKAEGLWAFHTVNHNQSPD